MATVSVRYIVNDVDAAIEFYCGHLGFEEMMHPAPTFAMLARGDLRLVLSAPSGAGGGGQPMADGTKPEPGGWNRFMLEVPDLASIVSELRGADVEFRNDIVTRGRRQTDSARRPIRQSNRVVRTTPTRGLTLPG
jgi:catechol 2,3-dioxygenase-like lactoylglutathione lyase family enzyme